MDPRPNRPAASHRTSQPLSFVSPGSATNWTASPVSPTSPRSRSRVPVLLAHVIPRRTSITHRHFQQELLLLGRDLPRAVAVAAMVDRLVHHAEVIVLKCQSHRLKGKREEVATKPPLDRAVLSRPRPCKIQPALPPRPEPEQPHLRQPVSEYLLGPVDDLSDSLGDRDCGKGGAFHHLPSQVRTPVRTACSRCCIRGPSLSPSRTVSSGNGAGGGVQGVEVGEHCGGQGPAGGAVGWRGDQDRMRGIALVCREPAIIARSGSKVVTNAWKAMFDVPEVRIAGSGGLGFAVRWRTGRTTGGWRGSRRESVG